MSIGKSGNRQSTKSDTNIDPITQQRMQEMWQSAQNAGNAGPSPLVTGATDYNSGAMKTGMNGLNAMGGDPNAVASFMNPYQKNVIDQMNQQFGQMNQQTMMGVNDAATRAGAFGGSRHGVATGTALAENARTQSGQVAGLLNSGFSDAMQRAAQSAAMGFQGAGNNANLGMGGVGNPEQWRLMMQKAGFMGPMGQRTSGATSGVEAGFKFEPLKMFSMGMGGGGG